jgi:predicted regulator of Ras-like GTPase activity (Roadblock/LC7/MglB family)
MSFSSILQEIVDGCDGAIGAALMGVDGIPIQQVLSSRGSGGMPSDDIAAAGVEFGRVLADAQKAGDTVAAGELSECTVVLSRMALVFRIVDLETFLVVVLRPDGNFGKARYLIRRSMLSLLEEL